MMRRKVLGVFGIVLGAALLAAGGLTLRAKWWIERSHAELVPPAIHADASPASLARGELLFQSLCMECHGGADGRATGKRLDEVPSFLGEFWSANLAEPESGVRRRSDAELARVLRHGVLPDGRLSLLMSGFNQLGDSDVAALIAYMHSDAPVFAATSGERPRSRPSLIGALIVTYVAKLRPGSAPEHLPVPPKAPSIEYGRYMAQALDCVGCHTDGFSPDKLHEPHAFAGGFEMTDPTGTPIFTRNITFDRETGIGRWSVDDFERALTRGIRPDGFLVRKPMPLFSRLERTDVEALYAFLRSIPPVHRPNTAGGHPLQKARPDAPADEMFVQLGCAACHGDTAPHRDKLNAAQTKPDSDVARWILDPQTIKPGSSMPSFQGAIDRAQAERLARYVKELARKRS